MEELLRFVFSELEKRNITYMLSGSMALYAYVLPRFTRDADIVIELRDDNFDQFAEIFRQRDCYFHQPSALEEVRRQGMFNVIDWSSGMKIDFIIRKNDAFQQAEFERRRYHQIMPDVNCWVISLEDLIVAKLLWIQDIYSEQQAIDIKKLLDENLGVDLIYINNWIEKLRLTTYNLLPV